MKAQNKKSLKEILDISNDFASLISIDADRSCVYEFTFKSDVAEALRRNANTVEIILRKQQPRDKTDVFESLRSSKNYHKFLSDILQKDSATSDSRNNTKNEGTVVLMHDLTAAINNNIASKLSSDSVRTGVLGSQRMIQLKSTHDLKRANKEPAIMQTTIAQQPQFSSADDVRVSSYDLIMNGIDPSTIAEPQYPVIATHSAFAGFSTHAKRNALTLANEPISPISRAEALLVSAVFLDSRQRLSLSSGVNETDLIPIISDSKITKTINTVLVRVPADFTSSDFYVAFQLVGASGRGIGAAAQANYIVEDVIKRVRHSELVRLLETPRIPPRVSAVISVEPGKNVIEIEQRDPVATGVRIMRRLVTGDGDSSTTYEFITNIFLSKKDGAFKFYDIVNNMHSYVYRCISFGLHGNLSAEFTSAVSRPFRLSNSRILDRQDFVVLHIAAAATGHNIVVSSIPSNAVSVGVMRRDLTAFERLPKYLDDIQRVNTNVVNMTFNDENLKHGHVYEYTCVLFLQDGSSITTSTIVEKQFIPLATGNVNLSVSDVAANDQGVPAIKFNLKSKFNNQTLNDVKLAIEKQDMAHLFQDEIKSEREDLQQLVSHKIDRVDLTTGKREVFDSFMGDTFEDNEQNKKPGMSSLKPGHKYKYVISTQVRNAETMFEKYKKSVVDKSTGKPYVFSPSKALHPITLRTGTIVSRESLDKNHPENEFYHGSTGNSYELDVTLDKPAPQIVDISAKRVNHSTTLIKWNLSSAVEDLDHFIITKQLLGQTSIIGKCHNVANGKSFEFIDSLSFDDIGNISYDVIPVLNDYSRAQRASTNKLTIVDGRGD